MKRSRFSEEQIIAILKEQEAGVRGQKAARNQESRWSAGLRLGWHRQGLRHARPHRKQLELVLNPADLNGLHHVRHLHVGFSELPGQGLPLR
ncbi:MAG: hypothetical protein ACK5PF_03870 [bacterium]|jgi:hypothetical protein